jgi:2-methylisocitrate lyase-like PEP mutase family enzyme
MPGRRVVPLEDMVLKIRVACDSRSSADFVIIARTDARDVLGLDEALRRAEAYAAAGADLIFVEAPRSEDELVAIARRIDKPLVANMASGGRTPIVAASRLEEIGYRLAIFPGTGFLAAGAALAKVYAGLKQDGIPPADVPLYPFMEFSRLLGFEDVWEFEQRYPTQPKSS